MPKVVAVVFLILGLVGIVGLGIFVAVVRGSDYTRCTNWCADRGAERLMQYDDGCACVRSDGTVFGKRWE